MTSQQGLSCLGVGGVVEGCGHSHWQIANLSQPPPVQGRCLSPGIETPGGCKQRDPPQWRVSRMGLPTQAFTWSAIAVTVQRLYAAFIEIEPRLGAVPHLLAESFFTTAPGGFI